MAVHGQPGLVKVGHLAYNFFAYRIGPQNGARDGAPQSQGTRAGARLVVPRGRRYRLRLTVLVRATRHQQATGARSSLLERKDARGLMGTTVTADKIVNAPETGRSSPAEAEQIIGDALNGRRAAAPAGAPPVAGAPPAGARAAGRPGRPPKTRPSGAGGAVGGHKATKGELQLVNSELERRVRELEGQLSAVEPERAAMLRQGLEGALATTFRAAGGIAARLRRAPFWRLETGEAEQLAGAWAPVLEPHLGKVQEHAPLVAALVVTYEVIGPRAELEAARAGNIIVPASPQPFDLDAARA